MVPVWSKPDRFLCMTIDTLKFGWIPKSKHQRYTLDTNADVRQRSQLSAPFFLPVVWQAKPATFSKPSSCAWPHVITHAQVGQECLQMFERALEHTLESAGNAQSPHALRAMTISVFIKYMSHNPILVFKMSTQNHVKNLSLTNLHLPMFWLCLTCVWAAIWSTKCAADVGHPSMCNSMTL